MNAILPGLMKTPMVEHSAGLAQSYAGGDVRGDVARPRRPGADGAYGRRLGTSPTPRCFSPPTSPNMSPASSSWSTAASPASRATKAPSLRGTASAMTPVIDISRLEPRRPFDGGMPSAARMQPARIPAPCRPSIPPPAWRRSRPMTTTRSLRDCGALIDNEKTAKADRVKALVARAAVFTRKDQLDRAHRRLRRGAAARAAGRHPQQPRRAVVEEGRPAEGAGRFRRRDQTQPGSSGREGATTSGWRRSWSGSAR